MAIKKLTVAEYLVKYYGLSSNYAGVNDTLGEHIKIMSDGLKACGINPEEKVK